MTNPQNLPAKTSLLFQLMKRWRSVVPYCVALIGLCAAGMVQANLNGGQATPQEAEPLELGKPVERELVGGQMHSYQIKLAAGQFLNVVVEQRGIDVVVLLLGPDGRQIKASDLESGAQGLEVITQVVEAPGSYQLKVQAKPKAVGKGSYKIQALVRAATEQDHALQQGDQLEAEFQKLARAGKYDEALPLLKRAIAIYEQALGPEHPTLAPSLYNLASVYLGKGDYASAEPLFKRALAMAERDLGPGHVYVANMLTNLAIIYFNQGDYARAEPLYQRALAIREKALGPGHPDVAAALINLANLYDLKGAYASAEPLYQRALVASEKAYGPEHPDVAACLNNLAELYRRKGDFTSARPLIQRALTIVEKIFGPEHPEVAKPLNTLANLYVGVSDFASAEPIYRRALAILEKAYGPEHPNVATSLNNLAELYQRKGDYASAEPLIKRALTIAEKTLGPDHSEMARYLSNLGALYQAKGDYASAEPLFKRALTTREKAFGPDHPEVINSLGNLATFYFEKGDYASAEPLFRRVSALAEKGFGMESPEIATLLNNQANFYYVSRGDYASAEPLHRRALTIREKVFGPEHPDVAQSLQNLALLYHNNGEYGKAEPLYLRAFAILEKAWGLENPRVALCLQNLAIFYDNKGDISQALNFASRLGAVTARDLSLNLASGSERQKLAYLATLSGTSDYAISLHVRAAPGNAVARDLAFNIILQQKGRLFEAMSDSFAALRRQASTQDQVLLDQLKETLGQLARLILDNPPATSRAEYNQRVTALRERREQLEAAIGQRNTEFRAYSQPVTVEDVRKALPGEAALVEFVAYHPFRHKAGWRNVVFDPPRYVAYALRQQGEARWVDLGEGGNVDRAVAVWRQALRDPQRARAEVDRLSRAVDEVVMRPVRALIGDTKRLLISPDGALNLIPFAALVDEQGRYLAEQFSLTYLTSGRDLLRLQRQAVGGAEPLVLADPAFGERTPDALAASRDIVKKNSGSPDKTSNLQISQSLSMDQVYFRPLPGAAEEAQALRALLPQARVLTGEQATEAAIKQAHHPRLLHIATHGFFLRDLDLPALNTRPDTIPRLPETSPDGEKIENPLLRSGLALAGANLRRSGEEDGILTALEAAGLDLWGTKLVVLSACDTGVGEVKNGEGVYGLRRALALAGSESQVMSLWAVSDTATRDLMVDYYQRLQRGEGRGEALRQAQLQMLRDPKRRHPYYWASFIQSGEWANLDGKR